MAPIDREIFEKKKIILLTGTRKQLIYVKLSFLGNNDHEIFRN